MKGAPGCNTKGTGVLRLAIVLVLSACSSGSETTLQDSSTAPTQVTLQVFDDVALTNVFSGGVSVHVYEDDPQVITRTVEVGKSGEASLGVFSETLSLTLVYRAEPKAFMFFGSLPSEFNELNIRSILKLPLAALSREDGRSVLKFRAGAAARPPSDWVTQLSLTARAKDAPKLATGSFGNVVLNTQPHTSPNTDLTTTVNDEPSRSTGDHQLVDGVVSINNFRLRTAQAQDDGLVSFLALIGPRNNNGLLKYGYLLDEELDSGKDYKITMDLRPIEIPVHTAALRNIDYSGDHPAAMQVFTKVLGERKGQYYTVSPDPSFTFGSFAENANQESIPLADQFPVESYVTELNYSVSSPFSAKHAGNDDLIRHASVYCTVFSESEKRPQEIRLERPSIDYLSLVFDEKSREFSWERKSSDAVRWQTLSLRPRETAQAFAHPLWVIDFNQSEESLRMPALPAELSAEIQTLLQEPLRDIQIVGYDYLPPINSPLDKPDLLASISADRATRCSRHEIITVLMQGH